MTVEDLTVEDVYRMLNKCERDTTARNGQIVWAAISTLARQRDAALDRLKECTCSH